MTMRRLMIAAAVILLSGCTTLQADKAPDWASMERPGLDVVTATERDLLNLPPPAGVIPAAVYGFRDLTGQYRESPNSNLSTAVSQGGGSMLIEALLQSGWFQPVEREGLQDLLTERRVARQLRDDMPGLVDARIILEGGITGYDRNLATGGFGASYFGLAGSETYIIDRVTVSLRAVNVTNGQVLSAVTTTKTIYSYELAGGLFRFVRNQRLLEVEGGYTYNEPRFLATQDAIRAAVIHLIVRGVGQNHWRPASDEAWDTPLIQSYRRAADDRQRSAQNS
jgi:curli production assembly/transport component CsgG